jgi:hypothetical protein
MSVASNDEDYDGFDEEEKEEEREEVTAMSLSRSDLGRHPWVWAPGEATTLRMHASYERYNFRRVAFL